MESLNNAIVEVDGLNTNYQIGAAYFLKLNELTFEQLWQKRAYTRGYFLNAMSFLPNDLTGYVSTPQSTATDELINASNAAAESMNTGAWNASSVPGAILICITEYVNVIFLCRMFTVVQILP